MKLSGEVNTNKTCRAELFCCRNENLSREESCGADKNLHSTLQILLVFGGGDGVNKQHKNPVFSTYNLLKAGWLAGLNVSVTLSLDTDIFSL